MIPVSSAGQVPPLARSRLSIALRGCRTHLVAAASFSAIGNLLYLAPSLYMLQVYDRVLPSRGLGTLAALSVLMLGALAALAVFEWLRSRVLIRASVQAERVLAGPALRIALSQPALSRLERGEVMRDVDTLRQSIASPAVFAALDAPWTPIYILVGFLLHPLLGASMVASGVLLIGLAWLMKQASEAQSIAYARLNHGVAHASEVRALGMVDTLAARHERDRGVAGLLQLRASFAGSSLQAAIKFVRLALQSGALALGAVLVVDDAISASAIIVASLLTARALAPIDQLVAGWKTIVQARIAYARLDRMLALPSTDTPDRTNLPAPKGAITLEGLGIAAPLDGHPILSGIDGAIGAGEVIGIAGPSGSGKSTLLRAIVGAVDIDAGHVRFDGISRTDWDRDRLARHIGYMPQDPVLFHGTVKENIVRFYVGTDAAGTALLDEAAIGAAKAAGAHDLIAALPQGYDTILGVGGTGLSGGQAQRVALARALFGNPAILVLDEPTAHLDTDGKKALARLLASLRQAQRTILFASHDPDLLAASDRLMLLDQGRIERFGPLFGLRSRRKPDQDQPTSFVKA
jgi:ATP-binding cassette subfamily C protein